jgi:hypothetical protein
MADKPVRWRRRILIAVIVLVVVGLVLVVLDADVSSFADASSFASIIARSTSPASMFKCAACFANSSRFCGSVASERINSDSAASLRRVSRWVR